MVAPTLLTMALISIGGSKTGETRMAELIDFSSIYSENVNITLPPLNSRVPAFGFDPTNSGGVVSSGPPFGGEIAAQE